jgi:hypothetical protein
LWSSKVNLSMHCNMIRLHSFVIESCAIKYIQSNYLLFNTEISSTEYRDVQYQVPRCRICSVPRCPGPEMSWYHTISLTSKRQFINICK